MPSQPFTTCVGASASRSSALASRQRRAQRHAVAGETLKAAAAAFTDKPSSTARTSA